jgi:hypothetical protein
MNMNLAPTCLFLHLHTEPKGQAMPTDSPITCRCVNQSPAIFGVVEPTNARESDSEAENAKGGWAASIGQEIAPFYL